ncbi:uncharacterized protein [Chironomus tepperi]|uniref:uncharacterized protein n=1 Tax=Chironomus tepperi TaxID=113505 RepID=UPI00391F37A8
MADEINIKFLNPIRLLVYCVNTSKSDINSINTKLVIPPYYYFIISNGDDTSLELYTFENLADLKYCIENQTLIKINEFSSIDLKWTILPPFPKKYKNFHNCTMLTGTFGREMFIDYEENPLTNRVDAEGPGNDIMDFLGNELNFNNEFCLCKNDKCTDHSCYPIELYNLLTVPPLNILVKMKSKKDKSNYVMLNIESEYRIYVPSPDYYTPIEKLALPFDFHAWILISTTAVSTIIFVTIAYGLQQTNYIIKCIASFPLLTMKTIRIIFGIGHTKLSSSSLLSFWC